jgi:hypothetical protein
MADLDTHRTDLLLQFILAKAAESDDWNDRELGPIHLLKYCYVADLAFAERNQGQTLTGAEWRFYHFGPWQPSVHERIEPALAAVHTNVKKLKSQYDGDFLRYSLPKEFGQRVLDVAAHELPVGVLGAVERWIREHGSNTASLLHDVYLTRPMLHAAPGETLDLRPQAVIEQIADSVLAPLGKRQQRLRSEALGSLRTRLQDRLRSGRETASAVPAPRYDDVFETGTKWLDSLAGEAIPLSRGDITIDDSLWRSDQRTDRDVP